MTWNPRPLGLVTACLLITLLAVSTTRAETVLNTENGNSVTAGAPSAPTQFALRDFMVLTTVRTYHWNNGQGAPGGTISITNQSGKAVYSGPAVVLSKYYWQAEPKLVFPPGSYTLTVSAPATWAHNAASGNRGMALVNADAIPSDAKGPVQSYFQKAPSGLSSDDKGPVTLPTILAAKPSPVWAVRNTGSATLQVTWTGGGPVDVTPGTVFTCLPNTPCASSQYYNAYNKTGRSTGACPQQFVQAPVDRTKCIKLNLAPSDCVPKPGNVEFLPDVKACN